MNILDTEYLSIKHIDKKARVLGVDTVRAFAALSVLLAHVLGPALPALTGTKLAQYIFTGHPAVIAFFVVSGFCIHYPYTDKQLKVFPFWVARWTRIMIPVIVAIGLAKVAHISKYNFWDGYILWSIVCELVYYTLYPGFRLLARIVSWKTLFYISMAISFALVIILGTNQYGGAQIYGPFLNWLIALPSWLIGCVLAEHYSKKQEFPDQLAANLVLWRLVVAVTASLLYWLTMNTIIGYYLTMNAFSLVVFLWIAAEINEANKTGVSVFESVGRWSYSIYLFHIIIFAYLGMILPVGSPLGRALAIPVVLAGCYLAYRMVEEKSHRFARKLFKKMEPSASLSV